MNWKIIMIWITLALESCVGISYDAGTLRDVIWEYKHFLIHPNKNMCNMTRLLKSCEKDLTLKQIAVAFRVTVVMKRDKIYKLHCAATRRHYVQGCFRVECMDMPPRVWCRTYLPKCLLFGKVNSTCRTIKPEERKIKTCTNDYVYYPKLCQNYSANGLWEQGAKDFIFCAEHLESSYQLDAEGFIMDYVGPLRPSNMMLFTLICIVAPLLVRIFLPNFWIFITYALIFKREVKPVKVQLPPKRPCPPVPPFCWRRWLLGWLLWLCEKLRPEAGPGCRGPPFYPPPSISQVLLGTSPCKAVCGSAVCGPPPPLPSPRDPLFSRNTRFFPEPVPADVEYRLYHDSLFSTGREEMTLPFGIEGQDGTSVCLRPIGAAFESREYATVQRLLAGYRACRRGLCTDTFPEPQTTDGWVRFSNLGVDPRRLVLVRTYLGNLQEAYNCLQPNTLLRAQLEASDVNNVYAPMIRAQEKLRHTLWREIENAAKLAGSRKCCEVCECGGDDDESNEAYR